MLWMSGRSSCRAVGGLLWIERMGDGALRACVLRNRDCAAGLGGLDGASAH